MDIYLYASFVSQICLVIAIRESKLKRKKIFENDNFNDFSNFNIFEDPHILTGAQSLDRTHISSYRNAIFQMYGSDAWPLTPPLTMK